MFLSSGWENAKVQHEVDTRVKSQTEALRQAGTGPVPQTFAQDPTRPQPTAAKSTSASSKPVRRKVRWSAISFATDIVWNLRRMKGPHLGTWLKVLRSYSGCTPTHISPWCGKCYGQTVGSSLVQFDLNYLQTYFSKGEKEGCQVELKRGGVSWGGAKRTDVTLNL